MVHRKILGFLSDHKYASAGAGAILLMVMLGGLAQFFSQGSFVATDKPSFGDCSYNDKTGNIQGGCGDQRGWIDDLGYGFGGDSTPIWVNIDGIRVADGTDVDEKSPQFWWLYRNDYLTDEAREEIRQGDFPGQTGIRSFQWNSTIKQGMEAATVCSAEFKVATSNNLNIETSQGTYRFERDPDSDERHINTLFGSPVKSTAEEVVINENSMYCKFDLSEIMNKGLNVPGEFERWFGSGSPYIGGMGKGGSTSFDIDFNIDSDLDGIQDENDECPYTEGLESKNGCPNEESQILGIDGSQNVTVGEEVEYTASIRNPDNDDQTFSWSNGESGRTASYSFNSTGEKTVSISVSDGFTTSTRSVKVNVEEKSLLDSFFGFFEGIWSVLTFSG